MLSCDIKFYEHFHSKRRSMAPNIVRSAIAVFFEYDTPKIVHIRSKKVGVINRFIQLCIIVYVIGYAIVYKKGYQEFGSLQSAVTTKVKGIAMVDTTKHPNIQEIWDVADYVVPSQENNAFFVITNLKVTPDQSIRVCSEDSKVKGAICNQSSECTAGKVLPNGNGVMTGDCIDNRCQIHAWCPVENGTEKEPDVPLLLASENFTVFIKNNIEFPKFDVKRRNIPNDVTDQYLQTCNYNPGVDTLCPIFRLKSITEGAGVPYRDMAKQGGVMEVIIEWVCNLDYNVDNCIPKYKFRRLDSAQYTISAGYNFRYARYYKYENGTEYRTLYKAYGIKYIVTVTGEAGKFNFEPFMINIGSGLGLLTIATILCDIVVLYVLKARKFYKNKKYLEVQGDDAYEGMTESDD